MKTIYLLFTVGVLFSCSKNDGNEENSDCIPQELVVKSLETEYGCSSTKYQLQSIAPNDGFIIIRNQEDFNNQTDDVNCRPTIDFGIYDLVIGKKQLSTGNESIIYNYVDNCTQKTLTVTFVQNETMQAPTIIYHALIPKLEPNEQINIETIVE